MEKTNLQELQTFIKTTAQLLSLSKLYGSGHSMFKEKLAEVMEQLKNLTSGNKSLVMASSEGVLFINGEKVELKNSLMQHFMKALSELKLGSVDIEPAASVEEITILINILNQKENVRGVDQLKDYFKNKNITSIIPRFAAYKLVKEDETVVKDKGTINISDLPPEILEKFSQDLGKGEVAKAIKGSDANYKTVAHDPIFLSGFVYNTVEKKNSVEELERILWFVGDYLIGEISTAKEEEINRKLIEEFKKRLLALWENKKDKNWEAAVHKNITAISAALELKGLLILYKKHKKEFEGALNKIKSILESLPPESQLYKEAKAEMGGTGPEPAVK